MTGTPARAILRSDAALAAGVALATLAAFWPALGNGWVNWDDDIYLLNNPGFRGLGWENIRWMLTNQLSSHYQPLAWLSYALDYQVWGLDPRGYHLTSLLLHILNAILVYALAARIFAAVPSGKGDRPPSGDLGPWPQAVAALLFAVHPLRVESVAWASERRDVLYGAFYLGSVLAYLRQPAGRGPGTAGLLLYGGALLSKSMAVTLPVVLLILDWFPLRRVRRWSLADPEARRAVLEKIPYLLASAVIAALALREQDGSRSIWTLEQYGLIPRLGQAAYGLAFYLGKTLFPIGLSPIYEIPADVSVLRVPCLIAAAAVAGLSWLFWRARARQPAWLAAWLCYAVILSPVLGLLQSGPQLVADRYSYLACVPGVLLAAGGWSLLASRRRWGAASAGGAAAALGVLGALTWNQAGAWRGSRSLWTQALSAEPHSAIAHNNMGMVLIGERNLQGAAEHFKEALRIDPRCVGPQDRLFDMDDLTSPEALALMRVLQVNPLCRNARLNLFAAAAALGEIEPAVEYFRRLLRVEPLNPSARANFERARGVLKNRRPAPARPGGA